MKRTESKLRVLFLSPHYPPDVAATGQLVAELAEDLVAAGHEAIVMASRPSYTDDTHSSYKILERELRNGVEIHWLGVPRAGRRGIWSRLLPFAGYFAAAALRSAFIRKIDIVFAQSTPPLLAGLLASTHSLLPGRRFVYNLQDVYPELGQEMGVLGDGVVTGLSKRIESRLRHRADLLTVLSQDMKARILSSDRDLNNISIVSNWTDTKKVVPVAPEDNRFRQQHGLAGRFVVMYSGNLGRVHGVELLPEVAAALADLEDLVLLIVGSGPAKATVANAVEKRGLKNVMFLPYQPKEGLNESLSAADVALILQRRSASGLVVPSKLYGILASGRPAVAAVPPDCEVARVLREERAGIVVEPESAKAIANAVRELYLGRARAAEMGKKARLAAIDRHDRRQATGRYIKLFEQLTS
ncbi:MAG: glycosyltransferase family 4 protein [Gammaproteobacteria bacterium]|nr:glycosyltransferase family 4 protein [Gammaproteobacteria bacterium]